MSAVSAAAAERASARIKSFGARQPDALRLARYASLAVRVDAPLLRALRNRMLAGSDAGIEADLWFSPLTESVSSQGFVIDSDVVDQLRRDLAAELTDGEQLALDRAAAITATAHRRWPASLVLEERATWLALKRPPDAPGAPDFRVEIESLLRGMLKAMMENAARGLEVARWAQRALRRLPAAARETEAALLLALGAAERLGVLVAFSDADRSGTLPDDAAWVLPLGAFSQWSLVGLKRYAEGLEFLAPEQAPLQLRLPRTNPLFVQIGWLAGGTRTTQTVSVAPGRTLAIPASAAEIRLRTLAGEVLALDTVAATATAGAAPQSEADPGLTRACVLVVLEDRPPAHGFFVTRDVVLSLLPENEGRAGRRHDVVWVGGRLSGTVIAQRRGGEVLIRLERELPEAVPLPREDNPSAPAVPAGSRWRAVALDESSPVVLEGVVRGAARPPPDSDWPLLRLTEPEAARGRDMSGTAIVIDGKIAGYVVPPPSDIGSTGELYARHAVMISPFISDVLRPEEEDPVVFVSYAPRDEYGKGIEIDEDKKEWVMRALRAARVKPRLDEDLGRGRTVAQDDVVAAVNESRGGALFLTPVSHLASEATRSELLALAYRRWAKPDYPLGMFQFRRSRVTPAISVPPVFETLAGADLDKMSDDELNIYIRRTFGSMSTIIDEAAGHVVVRERLQSLLSSVAADPGSAAGAVMSAGVKASFLTSAKPMPMDAAREIVEIAAMFSFAPETHRPLLSAMSSADGPRAFSINALQMNVAHALIRRTWIGQAPPVWIEFRDNNWSALPPQRVVNRVYKTIVDAVHCSTSEAQWLVNHVAAPVVLIFNMGPAPASTYIAEVRRALPPAILFFLAGSQQSKQAPTEAVVELPRLPPGVEVDFLQGSTRLLESLTVRQTSAKAPRRGSSPSPAPVNPPIRKKAGTKRAQRKR